MSWAADQDGTIEGEFNDIVSAVTNTPDALISTGDVSPAVRNEAGYSGTGGDALAEERAVEKAVLLTVHYRNLFRHAPTLDQLHRYLVGCRATRADVAAAIRRLAGGPTMPESAGAGVSDGILGVRNDRVYWRDSEPVAGEMRERTVESALKMAQARRWAEWLRRMPYIRMVAVTGSLAAGQAAPGHDVDLLCVAARGRVWIVVTLLRSLHVLISRASRIYFCANCVLDESDMAVRHENLYLAHQIAQMVPLWGGETLARFHEANRWVRTYLPNAILPVPLDDSAGRDSADSTGRRHRVGSRCQRGLEALIPATLARPAERWLHRGGWRRALAFYHPTHAPEVIAEARNPGRYMLPGLGYAPVIRRHFVAGHPALHGRVSAAELESAFGALPEHLAKVDARMEKMWAERYKAPLANGRGDSR